LAQAVVESALRHGLGARIELREEADPFVWLFSESAGRAIVSLKEGADVDLASLCQTSGVALTKLGEVTAADDATVEVVGQFTLPLARIREVVARQHCAACLCVIRSRPRFPAFLPI
jgi:phosphoribosylformylglycinamidine synthase